MIEFWKKKLWSLFEAKDLNMYGRSFEIIQ